MKNPPPVLHGHRRRPPSPSFVQQPALSPQIKHFEHAWLKESWATYVECCWLEDTEGEEAFLYQVFNDLRAYVTEAEEDYVRPIATRTYNSSWAMYDDHLYPGGSCRLHMLRHLLGDDVFWRAVRLYVQRHARGLVETGDFRRAMEEVGWAGE